MLYNINKRLRRKKTTHTIRTDFGFNLLRSASKLNRGVIELKNCSFDVKQPLICQK